MHFLLRTLLGAFLSILFIGCSENDATYGESVKDYTVTGTSKDADAANYFRQKEVACVTDKSRVEELTPNWINVQLIIRSSSGGLDMLPSKQLYASLRANYEVVDGGRMTVNLLTDLGFNKTLRLYPCNTMDSYFYVADLSPDGATVQGVKAYSVASGSLPPAYELGFEHHDPRTNSLESYTVVGIGIPSKQTGKRTVKEILGNTGYLAYKLRSSSACTTSGFSPRNTLAQTALSCRGVKWNNTPIHTASVGAYFEDGDGGNAPGLHLFNDASSRAIARFGDVPQASNTYNTPVRITYKEGGKAIFAYSTWAYLGLPPYETNITITVP